MLLSLELPKHTIQTPDIDSEEQKVSDFSFIPHLATGILNIALRVTMVISSFCLSNYCVIKANDTYTAFKCYFITTFNKKNLMAVCETQG